MLETIQQKLKYFLVFPCLLILATSCGGDTGIDKNKDDKDKERDQSLNVEMKQQKTVSKKSESTKQATETNKNLNMDFDAASLAAFETCTITDSFLKTRESIIKNLKPLQTSEGYLTYQLDSMFSGLPVKKVIFGACSVEKPLQDDCSFIEEVAFILDVDFDKAKAQLLSDKGIDFTIVKRATLNGEEEGPTLHPVLYQGKDDSTVLHCDTGGL